MAESHESNWRRREDEEWKKKVDHLQSTLLTAHQNMVDKQNKIETVLEELDEKLRGDGTTDNQGISGMVASHDARVTRIEAVLFQDSTGEHGALADLAMLKRREVRAQWLSANRTTVLVAVVGLIGIAVTNLEPIGHFWEKHVTPLYSKKQPEPPKKAQGKRSGKSRRVSHVMVPAPAPLPALTGETTNAAANQDVPN